MKYLWNKSLSMLQAPCTQCQCNNIQDYNFLLWEQGIKKGSFSPSNFSIIIYKPAFLQLLMESRQVALWISRVLSILYYHAHADPWHINLSMYAWNTNSIAVDICCSSNYSVLEFRGIYPRNRKRSADATVDKVDVEPICFRVGSPKPISVIFA